MKNKNGSGLGGLSRSGIHGPKAGQGPLVAVRGFLELIEKLTRNGWKDFQWQQCIVFCVGVRDHHVLEDFDCVSDRRLDHHHHGDHPKIR